MCFWRLKNTWTPGKNCMMRSPQHIVDGEPENYLGIIIFYTPFNVIVFSRGQNRVFAVFNIFAGTKVRGFVICNVFLLFLNKNIKLAGI